MKSARDDSLCKWRRHWPFLFISYSLSTTIPTTTTSSSSSSTLIRLGSSSRAPVQYGKRRRTATSQPAVPTQSDSPLPKCAARDGALLLVDVWSKSVNKKEENKGGKKKRGKKSTRLMIRIDRLSSHRQKAQDESSSTCFPILDLGKRMDRFQSKISKLSAEVGLCWWS